MKALLAMDALTVLLSLAVPIQQAHAQSSNVMLAPNPLAHSNNDVGVTITSSTGGIQIIAAGTYGFADIANQTPNASLMCAWGVSAVLGATAGQRTISQLGELTYNVLNPPPQNKALTCICSLASCPATVLAY